MDTSFWICPYKRFLLAEDETGITDTRPAVLSVVPDSTASISFSPEGSTLIEEPASQALLGLMYTLHLDYPETHSYIHIHPETADVPGWRQSPGTPPALPEQWQTGTLNKLNAAGVCVNVGSVVHVVAHFVYFVVLPRSPRRSVCFGCYVQFFIYSFFYLLYFIWYFFHFPHLHNFRCLCCYFNKICSQSREKFVHPRGLEKPNIRPLIQVLHLNVI